jgi:lycopene beta-cyclase
MSAHARGHLDADVIVVGAGLSGLSVTVALLDAGLPADARVLLVDPRTALDGHDRTWCFFDVAPHAFTDAVAHHWSRWHVRCEGRELNLASPGLTYCHIPGTRFYDIARARLAQAGDRVALRLGTHATRIDDHGDHVVVHTHEGPLRARLAFDSRPPPLTGARLDDTSPFPADGHVRLLQHFRGRVVRTQAPIFEDGLATLMDFDVDQTHGIHFVYMLPFDAHTALVESTFFTPRVLPDDVYERAIDAWLAARKPGHAFETVSREHGVIPMTTEPFDAHPSPRVVRIGTAGGAAKPSTGYAFLAVQRFARAFAPRVLRALREGGVAVPPEVRSDRTTALDTVFLSYLAHHPARAPRNFFHLFERVPPALLVRFLSDGSSIADDLRVMRAGDIPRLSIETARTAPLLRRLGR